MRILVTGSRDWADPDTIHEALDQRKPTVIVHGGCPSGADTIAHKYAIKHGIQVEVHRAEWGKHGRKAGPIRNQKMVDLGADVCLAFIRNNSRGATHCAQTAIKSGIFTDIHRKQDK